MVLLFLSTIFFIGIDGRVAQRCGYILIGRPKTQHQEVKAAANMVSRSSAIQSRDVSSTEVCFFLCCAVSFCLFYGVVLDLLIENVLINFAFIIIHGSPVDMLHSLFPHYSFPFISYGYFFQITLLNTCKFHSI